jgi:DNA polymerase zeta
MALSLRGCRTDGLVTPNGMVFVKPAVRKSLLAKMLAEILDTRVMIKHAMKGCRNDKVGLVNDCEILLKIVRIS